MFSRISNSWQLVKASWQVLQADKELLIFPVAAMIASIIVTITFLIPLAAAGLFDAMAGAATNNDSLGILSAIIGFIFYAIMYSITIYSNTALVGAAMIRLDGGNPTVQDGIRIANERLSSILVYSLISATVGTILNALSERAGWLGQIVISIIGLLWNLATFLVIPILVVENVSPMDAIKRSVDLLKRTWGEQIVGNFSIGAIFGLIMFLVVLGGVPVLALAASTESPAVIITVILLMVVVLMGLGLVSAALNGIFTAALYRYATGKDTSEFFAPELIQGAFKPKRGVR